MNKRRNSRGRKRLRSIRHQKRSRVVSVRFSPHEYGELVNFAWSCNQSVSSLIRAICFDKPIAANQPFSTKRIIQALREIMSDLSDLATELSEDGNNSECSTIVSSMETRLLNLVKYLEKVNSKFQWNRA